MGANCSNITYEDENVTDYVFQTMGQRCLSPTVAAVTLMFYSIILFFGLFGNLITAAVIVKNPAMHTATNYYLFNLALADFSSLVLGLPFELRTSLTTMYPDILPEYLCKLRSYASETTSYASVLTVTAFSVERWLAICFPLRMKMFSKLNRAVKVVLAIWLVSLACAAPVFNYTVLNRIPVPLELLESRPSSNNVSVDFADDGTTIRHTDYCALKQESALAQRVLINFAFWAFFVVPLTVISVLYLHIVRTIHRAMRQAVAQIKKHDAKKLKRRKIVINMLVAVVSAFFLCWLPYHVQRMATLYVDMLNLGPELLQFFNVIFYVSGYFYYANSAINPILYSILNDRFRRAFLFTLKNCFKHGRRRSVKLLPNNNTNNNGNFQGNNYNNFTSKNFATTYGGVASGSPIQKFGQWSMFTKYSSD